MKFKKLRLLALAMTVAVATSAMPSVAFAEDFTSAEPEEVVEVTEVFDDADAADVAAQESDAYQVDPATIKWDFDEVAAQKIAKEDQSVKVTWTEKPVEGATGDPYDLDKKVTEVLKITEPGVDPLTGKVNCLAPGYVWFTTVIDGQVYNSGDPNDPNTAFVWRYAPGHKYAEIQRKVIKGVSCASTEEGLAHVWYKCSVCGDEYDEDVVLEIPDHEWSADQRYVVSEDTNTKLVNGEPQLIDATMDGTYQIETYRVCTKCGKEEILKTEEEELLATKGVKAFVTAQENIADDLIGLQYSEENKVPAWDEIELKNCNEYGYYEVTFYTYDDKPISHEWIPVEPHHMTKDVQVEFIHPDDVDQCIVTYKTDEKGNRIDYTIVNQHCTDPVTYYVVEHCYAEGCPNKACADAYYPALGEDHYTEHEVTRTEKSVEATGDHVINNDIYKQVAALTQPVDYAELAEICAHDTVYVKLSVNNATCTEPGSVTVEYICKLCKNVIKTQTVATKALGHVPLKAEAEKDENDNMIGELPTCEKEGWYNAVIYCKRCGEELARRDHVRIPRLRHSNEIEVTQAHGDGSDEIKVNDDVMNTLNNVPRFEWSGYVVVDDNSALINRTKTFEEVSAKIAGGDDTTTGGDEVLTVSVDAVTYCNLLDHDHNRVLLEDDNVTVTVVSVEKQGADCQPGKIVLKATYDNGTVKTSEEKEFLYYTSLETYRGRTAHDPLDPVKENEVAPTGTTAGSYDLVTYCRVCGAELSRETKSYEHECVAGEAVQENYKDATCTEAGSYDEVTYCTLCNKELSRETKTIEAKGHQFGEFEEVERVEPTALKDGYVKTARTCEICGITEEETEVLPATGDYTVPAKVTNIKTTANEGKQKIRVEYAAVKDAEKYRIYWKAHGDASYQKKDTANLSYTISGLTPNTLYDIRVRAAKKVDGEWVWGTTSGVYRRWLKTVVTDYTKTSNSITVNITPVEGAVKYQIHISEYKDMTDETVKSVKSTTTAYTIKGLDPATKYYIRVRPITTADGKNYTGALNAVKGVKTKK